MVGPNRWGAESKEALKEISQCSLSLVFSAECLNNELQQLALDGWPFILFITTLQLTCLVFMGLKILSSAHERKEKTVTLLHILHFTAASWIIFLHFTLRWRGYSDVSFLFMILLYPAGGVVKCKNLRHIKRAKNSLTASLSQWPHTVVQQRGPKSKFTNV